MPHSPPDLDPEEQQIAHRRVTQSTWQYRYHFEARQVKWLCFERLSLFSELQRTSTFSSSFVEHAHVPVFVRARNGCNHKNSWKRYSQILLCYQVANEKALDMAVHWLPSLVSWCQQQIEPVCRGWTPQVWPGLSRSTATNLQPPSCQLGCPDFKRTQTVQEAPRRAFDVQAHTSVSGLDAFLESLR